MSRKVGDKNKPKFIVTTLKRMNEVFNENAEIRIDAAYALIIAKSGQTDLSELTPSMVKKMNTELKKNKNIAIRKLEFNK
jgi:hypothetical protein